MDRPHDVRDPFLPVGAGGGGQHLSDDLRICGRFEVVAVILQVVSEEFGVDQVAVVSQRQRPVLTLHVHRLGVLEAGGAGSGVAGMADGDESGEEGQVVLVEHLRYQPHAGAQVDAASVACGDARALLAAVLEGVDAVEGDSCYVFVRRKHAEHAALLSPVRMHEVPCPAEDRSK